MIASVIHRLAGVSESVVAGSTADKRISLSEVRNYNSDLKQNEANENNLIIKIENIINVVVPGFKSALSHWELIGNTAQTAKYSLVVMGVAFGVVIWNLIPQGLPLKIVGSVAVAVFGAFVWQVHSIESNANNEKNQLNNLDKRLQNDITEFRKEVKKNGLAAFEKAKSKLPEPLKPKAINCISDDEIMDLFKAHIEQVKKKPFKEWVQSNDDLFLSLFEGLQEHGPFSRGRGVHCAIKAYNEFKNVIISYQIKPALFFNSQKQNLVECLNQVKEQNDLFKRFKDRFKEAKYDDKSDQYYHLVGMKFSKTLSNLYARPNQVKDLFSSGVALERLNNIIKEVTKHQYNRVFTNVFEQADMTQSEYENYIQWASKLPQSITDKDLSESLTLFTCNRMNQFSSSSESSTTIPPKNNKISVQKDKKSKASEITLSSSGSKLESQNQNVLEEQKPNAPTSALTTPFENQLAEALKTTNEDSSRKKIEPDEQSNKGQASSGPLVNESKLEEQEQKTDEVKEQKSMFERLKFWESRNSDQSSDEVTPLKIETSLSHPLAIKTGTLKEEISQTGLSSSLGSSCNDQTTTSNDILFLPNDLPLVQDEVRSLPDDKDSSSQNEKPSSGFMGVFHLITTANYKIMPKAPPPPVPTASKPPVPTKKPNIKEQHDSIDN